MEFVVIDPKEAYPRHVEAAWTNWLGQHEADLRRWEEDFLGAQAQIERLNALEKDGVDVTAERQGQLDRMKEVETEHSKALRSFKDAKERVARLKDAPVATEMPAVPDKEAVKNPK